MRTAVVCLALLAFLALPVGTAPTVGKPEEVGLSSERLQRVAQMIQRRIAAGDLAGAVVAVARKGRVAYVNAQGVMDLETKQPMTPANMFRIASMTKPVDRRGHHAHGRGREDADQRSGVALHSRVPQHESGGRAAGARRTRCGRGRSASRPPQFYTVPAQREITIKDLLTHTSGLGSGPMGNSDIEKIARKDGETLAQYIPRLGGTALEFQPGLAVDLQPWRGLRDARPRARDRLGHAARSVLPHAHLRSARHEGHHLLADRRADAAPRDRLCPHAERPRRRRATPNDTMSRNVYFRGSGGLYSTAEDYLPLGIMLAGKGEMSGKRLLSRKTVEMMSAAHVLDTLPGRPAGEGYGLSVRVVTNHAARGTMLSDGTFGWTGAQGTHFFVDPKEELTAVLMVQTSNGEIQRDFEDLVAQSVAD